MVGIIKPFRYLFFLIVPLVMSCNSQISDTGNRISDTVKPFATEITDSIVSTSDGVGQLAEDTREKILQGTKELVETASSNLKEVGENLSGEDQLEEGQTESEIGLSSDDGRLDLSQFSFEQQKLERDAAAAFLLEVRSRREIIQPGDIPDIVATVNIAAYARSTDHQTGKRVYRRSYMRSGNDPDNCARFRIKDDAQRYFLANGGPNLDPLKLDPDGDGYACLWNPEVFRLIVIDD